MFQANSPSAPPTLSSPSRRQADPSSSSSTTTIEGSPLANKSTTDKPSNALPGTYGTVDDAINASQRTGSQRETDGEYTPFRIVPRSATAATTATGHDTAPSTNSAIPPTSSQTPPRQTPTRPSGGQLRSPLTKTTTPVGGGLGSTPICPTCEKRVYLMEAVTALGNKWHKGCLRVGSGTKVTCSGRGADIQF